MAVNDKQKRYLKGLAHPLKPVVMVGNKGLTDNVLTEIDIALSCHELIKVKISGADKEDKAAMISHIANEKNADLVMSIGHVATFYRPAEEPTIQLPR